MSAPKPQWIDEPTTNLSPRGGSWPSLIVLHHSGGHAAGDIPTLTGRTKRRVSADFYVDKRGRIYKLNPQLTQFYTWHAGLSRWGGKWNVNKFSIGIEMEHMPGEEWTAEQVVACARLCAWLMDSYKMQTGCIQSHAAVAWPHGRKTDPAAFPWAAFSVHVAHARR